MNWIEPSGTWMVRVHGTCPMCGSDMDEGTTHTTGSMRLSIEASSITAAAWPIAAQVWWCRRAHDLRDIIHFLRLEVASHGG